MTKDTVKNYTLYKLRFWIGYGLLASLLVGIFVFAVLYVPGGLTAAEEQSALRSAALRLSDPASLLVVDLPYHALQKLSISLLGLSELSIKLPSLLLGIVAAVGLVLVLSRRFSRTVSILTAGIMMVSAQFIALVATGTPAIMMVVWPVLLLLVASFGIQKNRTLQPSAVYVGSVVAGLSLFTPFSIYILVALVAGGLLHPHIRYLFRKTPRHAVVAGSVIVCAALAVIAYASYRDLSFLAQLTYRSDHFSLDILANLQLLAMQLVDFSSTTTITTGLLAPIFGLTVFALAGLGVYSLFYWRHSVVSYIVFSWTLLSLPVLLLNPTSLPLLIVPLSIMVAAGSSFLLRYWYRLFPRNPYARVFALVPVTILFACIILSGTSRYFYAYHYYAPLANASSHDLALIRHETRDRPNAVLLVANSERLFYQLYIDTNHLQDSLKLSDDSLTTTERSNMRQEVIATRASNLAQSTAVPTKIIASDRLQTASDRLYIYTPSARSSR